MKTKEIDVWINTSDRLNDNFKNTSIHWTALDAENFVEKGDIQIKGKLVVDIPEPEMVVTPSQMLKIMFNTGLKGWSSYHYEVVGEMFGAEWGDVRNYDK